MYVAVRLLGDGEWLEQFSVSRYSFKFVQALVFWLWSWSWSTASLHLETYNIFSKYLVKRISKDCHNFRKILVTYREYAIYRKHDFRKKKNLQRTFIIENIILSRTCIIEKKISTVKGLLFSITSLFLENKYISKISYTRNSDNFPATCSSIQ